MYTVIVLPLPPPPPHYPSSFPEPFTFPTNYWVILRVPFLQYVMFTLCIVMLVDALKTVQCTTVISSGL